MGLLISFLTMCLHVTVILLVAAGLVWFLKYIGVEIDGRVYKLGQIVVGILCLIVILIWLSGVLGFSGTRLPMGFL